MNKYIQRITSKIPFTEYPVDIQVGARNLILTGGNGCGKTSFLKEIFDKTRLMVVGNKFREVDAWIVRRTEFENQMNKSISYPDRSELKRHIDICNNNILPYVSNPQVQIDLLDEFAAQVAEGSGAVTYFPATRQANIVPAKSASGLNYDLLRLTASNGAVGDELEQHLVNLATRRAFAEAPSTLDMATGKEINRWFESFEENLKFLFESPELSLKFNPDEFKFYILQKDKQPFTFQNLSSGYSAILIILSALLMRASYIKAIPSTLTGVIFIDEIDAHLHVSLQKKIFPFLVDSFPNLQFIVTTHSPFVLTSVNNATIYDMTKREAVEDLSAYSYESVLQGLFGVGPSSLLLQSRIRKLANLISIPHVDIDEVSVIVDELTPDIEYLDEESKYYLRMAEKLIQKG